LLTNKYFLAPSYYFFYHQCLVFFLLFQAYKGDVVKVKAGYARNHLVPQKMALYATPQNFERLGMVDPDYETEEQRIARLQRESNMTASEDKYLKEADLLKRYLKNKVVSNMQ
jgi:ribosomal protein L9